MSEIKQTAWEKVLLARKPERPKALDYIQEIFDDFIEFHGDRSFSDDKAIIGGIATLNKIPVTVIGEQKGKKAKENTERNFRNAKSRRLSKSFKTDETGRKI